MTEGVKDGMTENMEARNFIKIVEVGARDGLQNEVKSLPVDTRVEFIQKLSSTGLQKIEVGAFVSPKWVPQMANTEKILEKLRVSEDYSVLVPNENGMLQAMDTFVKEIAIFGACSNTFSQKNINCNVEESFQRFQKIIELAQKNNIRVRGYLSTAFGCPYEGRVSVRQVVELTQRMFHLGVYEISVGDTIGVATPGQINKLLNAFDIQGLPLSKVALHLHDTRGMALANVMAALSHEVTIFDSSLGGLGGCPYAKGATGNLPTEDLVYMLHGMGLETGIDLKKLIDIKPWIEEKVGRALPSKVTTATYWPHLRGP